MKVSNDVAPATIASDSRSTEPMDGNEFAALLAAMAAIPAMASPIDLLGAVAPEASAGAATAGPPALCAMPPFATTIDLTAFAAAGAAALSTAAGAAALSTAAGAAALSTAAGAAAPADTTFAVEVLSVSVGELRHDAAGTAAGLTTEPASALTPPPTDGAVSKTDGVATASAPAPVAQPAAPSPDAAGAAAAPTASGSQPGSTPVTATEAAPDRSSVAAGPTTAAKAAPDRPTSDTMADSSGGATPPLVAPLAATDVRDSAAPPLTVAPSRIDTVAVAAARASAEAGRPIRLTLRLDPPNLGELRVELTVRGGQVTVRLEPANSAAAPALHQQREAVAAALERSGFQLSEFDVENPEQQPQGDTRKRGTARAGFDVDETPTDEVEAVTGLRI